MIKLGQLHQLKKENNCILVFIQNDKNLSSGITELTLSWKNLAFRNDRLGVQITEDFPENTLVINTDDFLIT